VIDITARETDPDRYGRQINGGSLRVVVDLDRQLGWHYRNTNPSWLQFDFKTRRINISSCTIKFGYESLTQQWRLEGSHDGISWVTIDDCPNERKLHTSYSAEHDNCDSGSRHMFRYVRIRNVGTFPGGRYQLALTSIEFFGALKDEQQ
jgi:hypothetical protein